MAVLASWRTGLAKRHAQPKNVVAAFAAAPIGGAAVFAAIVLILGVLWGGWDDSAGAVAAMLFALISIVGYVGLLPGVLGYLLFRRLGWVRRTHWIVLGAVVGGCGGAIWPLAVLLLNPDVQYGIAAVAVLFAAGLLCGAASGLTFSLIIKFDIAGQEIAERMMMDANGRAQR